MMKLSISLIMFWILLLLMPLHTQGATLEELIDAALKKNPTAQAAALRVDAAKAMIKQARSAYYPRLSVTGSYTKSDNPTQAFMMTLNQRKLDMQDPDFDPNDPDDADNYRLSVGVKYRIFDGGRRGKQIDLVKLGRSAADYRLLSTQNELIHQVTQGYYSVLQARDFVEVQKESVTSLRENLRIANERFKAGSAVKTDVLNLEVKLAQAREDLIRAENGAQLAIAALNTAIGEDLVAITGLPAPNKKSMVQTHPVQDFDAVENRPELQAIHSVALMREQEYRKSIRGYFPVINAFGSYDWDSDKFSDFNDSYTVGVMAEWEFFAGFQKPSAVAQAKAAWQAAQQDEKETRNKLKLDLQQAYIQSGEARKRLSVVSKSVESAEEALRITTVRYKEGVADITELLTAQVGLTATHTRNVAAYYDYLIAISNVQRARGDLAPRYRSQK
jgi:outer membrane protein TolC